MQNVAQAWLIYRLTESSFMLGLAAFCGLFPVLILGLWGGVVADHVNRHRLLIIAHTAGLLQALILGIITVLGWVEAWHILVFSTLLGVIHAFEIPARHTFLSDMVDRDHLPNAIALNSSAFNIARFSGPFIAGLLIAQWGEGIVFLINAASFLAVLFGLQQMRISIDSLAVINTSVFEKIKQGLAFAWSNKQIRLSLILLSVFSVVGTSLTVLMPVFTDLVFKGNSAVLGILLGSMGLGALVGAFTLAYLSSYHNLYKKIGLSGFVAGICLVLFPTITNISAVLPILALFGFCQTILAASTNTMIQSLVDDHLRGRVMAIFSTVFIGFMPIGSILSGALAEIVGIKNTVYGFGVISIIVASVYLLAGKSRVSLNGNE